MLGSGNQFYKLLFFVCLFFLGGGGGGGQPSTRRKLVMFGSESNWNFSCMQHNKM